MAHVGLLLVSVLLFVLSSAQPQDHYSTLGVSRSASPDDIKKAFKKLTRKHHPDTLRDVSDKEREVARKRYMSISDAYEVLSDKKKREEYDNYGGRSGGSGDERMFLRHNLFAHDFDGEQLDAAAVEPSLMGNSDQAMLLFLWSSNIPDSIDPGLEYKRVAQRLAGSSVRVAAMRCDDMNYQMCRFGLQVPNMPALIMIPRRNKNRKVELYPGTKFEVQAMTEFGAKFLQEHRTRVLSSDLASLVDQCPDVSRSPLLNYGNWFAPYMSDLWKRSVGATWRHDFVALEFSPCFDCNTELQLAVEGLAPVMPTLTIRKVNCEYNRNKELCAQIAGKQTDRAWTIARISQRCFYATKKPYRFSDENCEAVKADLFDGKYSSGEFTQFMLGSQPTHSLILRSTRAVKQSNDSFAILFVDGRPTTQEGFLAAHPGHRHWEVLSRQVNTFRPVTGAKGHKLRLALVDCKSPATDRAACADVEGRGKPVVALYPFGVKAKQLAPTLIDRLSSPGSLLTTIQRDMEPLHLHVITGQRGWQDKIVATLEKGRKWIVLFNAGQWCPPCTQIRPAWRETTRIIQNHKDASQRLSVAVVECDEHRAVCNDQGIQNYPTVYLYSKGRDRVQFNGNRQGDAMAAWAIEAMDSRLQRLGFREIQMILQRQGTVVISFTAGQWCPPCMHLGPIYKQVANKLHQLTITEMDCDAEQWGCNQFGIQGYPTIVLYHKGNRQEYPGSMNKNADAIAQWIQANTK